jgi:hypothetical protein
MLRNISFISITRKAHEVSIQNVIVKRKGKILFRRQAHSLEYNIQTNFKMGCVRGEYLRDSEQGSKSGSWDHENEPLVSKQELRF